MLRLKVVVVLCIRTAFFYLLSFVFLILLQFDLWRDSFGVLLSCIYCGLLIIVYCLVVSCDVDCWLWCDYRWIDVVCFTVRFGILKQLERFGKCLMVVAVWWLTVITRCVAEHTYFFRLACIVWWGGELSVISFELDLCGECWSVLQFLGLWVIRLETYVGYK
eukprot:gene3121-2103_t